MAQTKIAETFKYGLIHKELDVRDVDDMPATDLHKVICDAVEATQKPLLTTLPDVILMNHKQYLLALPYTAEMKYTTDRIYITPFNIMEVEVDESYKHVDTDKLMEENFDKLTYDPDIAKFEQADEPEITQSSRWLRHG